MSKPTSWHSYSRLHSLGHSAVGKLFDGPITVEEKIDGSQFSFGVFDGQIKCRSKGVEIVVDAPEKMFALAIDTVKILAPTLVDGWTYRGEYLQKPKHNALAYDRVPKMHVMIFDIAIAEETYLSYPEKLAECERLGLEIVPLIYSGEGMPPEAFVDLLDRVSVLGGQKIEGVVIKNYTQYGPDKKTMIGKYVSDDFKEVHKGSWKESNPTSGDVVVDLAVRHRTPARWNKAIQHLREAGLITDSPKDIGPLLKEIQEDTKLECEADIKDALFRWAWPIIARKIIAGFPEYYKQHLIAQQGIE